jgi:hypothetical protein
MTTTEGELTCKVCEETVDPDSGWVVYVGYGQDMRPAPHGAFCSETHLIEWFQRRDRAAEPNGG